MWKSVGDVDFEAPQVIKLQLSLSASHPDSPSISAVFCQSLFETVSGRYSYGDVIHENTVFLAHHSPHRSFFSFNIHTLLSEREGAQLTQMLHKLQFSLNRVCFVRAKKCTRTATEK